MAREPHELRFLSLMVAIAGDNRLWK